MNSDPDFSESDPDFWPIRIWTQKKKSDPDPGKKTRSETLGTWSCCWLQQPMGPHAWPSDEPAWPLLIIRTRTNN